MDEITLSFIQLRGLIGQRLAYHGTTYTIIEVIEDTPSIIMQADSASSAIQSDAYGFARKPSKATVTIPILSQDKTHLHIDFLDLDLL
ncbi:hypothetical protein [Sulfurirhabdus autotrophica]|uniref:Uncharacterized protein n=1 Tax=Sulfurirhabdus autotrophica TaxID=1706046 RepID=A0A4R3XUJ0_9PROT|nr:hypothetical protein [Sulfurirhabdus autotrophica]TCV79127.1 hypothetical protein EDC63_13519 [Sulfurirhabdus autotrophica]